MKRFIISLLLLAMLPCMANAQDLITKKDGTDIEAKVLEVASTYVKYVKASNPDGPTYTIDTDELLMIRFENGDKEVFNNTSKKSSASSSYVDKPNVPYRILKNEYNPRDYVSSGYDKYSPGLAGVLSFLIPGLGQGICNEWGRACGFFFGNLALQSTGYVCAANQSYVPALIAYGAALGLDIWCICDAVSVAKVKNMYYNDNGYSSLNFRIEPTFAYVPSSPNALQPTYGLSMKVSF